MWLPAQQDLTLCMLMQQLHLLRQGIKTLCKEQIWAAKTLLCPGMRLCPTLAPAAV